ncbi:MAG: hypothetical protein HC911_16620 [Chloroflexaceae bacterium]|nr:hypothetical protein [Chloroflexaceae bacterium]
MQQTRDLSHRAVVFLIAGTMLLGIALRLFNLGMPIWGDEAVSWDLASYASVFDVWHYASFDPTPPLYYVFLHLSIPVFGGSPAGLRAISVIASILTAIMVYWGMRQATFRRADAFLAFLLTTVSSIMIYYAQEARAYALFTAIALGTTLLLIELIKNAARPALLLVYGVSVVLLSYVHGYGLFLVTAYIFCAILYRQWRIALLTLFLVSVNVVIILLRFVNGSLPYGAAGGLTEWQSIQNLITMLHAGTLALQGTDAKIPFPHLLAFPHPIVNFCVPYLSATLFLLICIKSVSAFKIFDSDKKMLLVILSTCILVPAGLGILAGTPLSPKPQWLLRGLVFLCPLYYMVTLAVLRLTRLKWGIVTVLLVLQLAALVPYYTQYMRFEGAVAFEKLEQQTNINDLVVVDPWYMHSFVRYYYRGPAPITAHENLTGWVNLAQMRQQNPFSPVPIELNPPLRPERIFVYYRKDELQWSQDFPSVDIFVYDWHSLTWQLYEK